MRESRNALRNGCSRDWLARQNSSGKAARGGLLAAQARISKKLDEKKSIEIH